MLGRRNGFARGHRLIRGRFTLDDPSIEADPFPGFDSDLFADGDGFNRNGFPPCAALHFRGLRDDGEKRLHNAAALLKAELLDLIDTERPKIVDIVHWAASNGDRSENGDYLYGKKRLREIDRRIRFLTKRLEIAEITDPSVHAGSDQVFFGATVTYVDDTDVHTTVTILGVDEADTAQAQVSWVSPIAQALLKAREGDELRLITPAGPRDIEVLEVRYPPAARAN